MKTKALLTYLSIAILFINDGCNENDNPVGQGGTIQPPVLTPLKVGNQWTYRSLLYDTLGTVQGVAETTWFNIVRDTTIHNEKWYFIGRNSTARELLTNRSDGLWYMRLSWSGTTSQVPVLFAKYPANANDTWLGPDSSTAMLSAKGVTVSVPQSSYTCFRYTYANKATQFVSQVKYFSLNVGFVRDEFYSKTNSGRSYVRFRRELLGFSLRKLSLESMNTNGKSSVQHDLFYRH